MWQINLELELDLANLRSLPSKTDEFLLLLCVSRKPGWTAPFQTALYICRISSWSEQILLWCSDAESTGKSRGGGTCFYINERWCTEVTVLKKMCCYDLETLFINCKRSIRCGSSVRSFWWVSTFHRKRTWAQLYRNSLIWSQTQNNNTRTLF